ncbi:MAG: UPF0182 family protein [Myxococcota bacterium]
MLLVVLLFVTLSPAARIYVDLLWFKSVGYEPIFTTILWSKVGVGAVVGLVFAVVLYANLHVAVRLTEGLTGVILQDPTGQRKIDVSPIVARLVLPAALVVGLFAGLASTEHWRTWLLYANASDFGTQDPIFGRDVGFYVFELPGLSAFSSGLMSLVGFSLFGAAVVHLVRGGLTFTGRGLRAERRTRVHLSVLLSALFLVLAFEAWLAMPELLFSEVGPVAGASYSDVNAKLPALQAQIAVSVIAAVLVAVSATRQRIILAGAAIVLYLVVELLAVRAYPAIVSEYSVKPNESRMEAPYIEHNIAATRAAYNLEGITERELSGEVTLDREDIDRNRATIENIRLWDHGPLLDTFAQIQEIRTYYEFQSVDNDRYRINGEVRQTMLSPRELAVESLPSRNWINEHFTYTHGYGITLGPVNTATPEGLPELFVQDIPPATALEGFEVTQPEIYFGELSNDYVFVRTANQEFDYPVGNERVYDEYDGQAGIHIDGFITTAAIAAHVGSLKLFLSGDIDEDSRVLLHRRINDRVATIAPFLSYDPDPYMVLREDGRLVWIYDAYTTTRSYPYSQPLPGMNYIRNSVKVVVDAYHGSVEFYVADDEDPILQTWQKIFPGTFRPMDEMADDLKEHLRYPERIFSVQATMFSTYHMASAELLYQREDQWEIPQVRRAETQGERMQPYYTIMRLPEEEHAEYIQMLPYTPERKQNLAAWMVARSDGENLGEMVVYRFPKDRLVFGPQQIMNRIDQEEDISRQLSLWDQRGSQAILGTLLVIPIEESLIYVCPLYLRASGGRIPELKRVIAVYENRIAMEETLDEAIDTLFGPPPSEEVAMVEPATEVEEPAGDPTGVPIVEAVAEGTADEPPTELAQRARYHFERATAAQREGDWARYGEELSALQAVLEELAP